MTSIYIPSSTSSGGGELAGQVYGKTSNTIISTTAVMNKPLTGLTAMTGAVVATDSILTGISKLSGNAGAATSNNVVNQIVKRDATGGFSAGIITTSGLSDGNSLILQTTSNLTRLGVNNGPTATGVNNTIVGVNAMNANSTASSNCMIGSLAGGAITSGGENTFVGHLTGNTAGVGLNTGSRNTLIGTGAITAAVNQTNSIAIGYAAQAPASNTVRFGNDSITNVYTTGVLNAGGLESIGTILNIASANNTNTVNICNGTGAQTINMGSTGAGVTTINLGGGSDIVKVNLPLKDSAGVNIIDIPTSNCMIGKNVLNNLNATSSSCTAVGVNIGGSNAENNTSNTFFGRDIAQSSTGSYSYCTAVGHGALKVVNSVNNTATGFNSLNELTTGLNNTGFGIRSGTAHTPLTTGNNNTFIGATSGSDNANRSNGTAIGQNARVDFDNCVQLGNTLVTQVRTSGTLYALGLESIGSTLSIASANNTNTVNIGSGTGVQTINLGNNGAGATTINIGGGSDTVTLGGSISSIESSVINFKDPTVVFGYGSAANSSGGAGIYLAEGTDTLGCYMRLSNDRTKFEFKPRVGANTFVINQSLQTTDTVTFGGLKLPTTGGTASNLDYYEEYSDQMKFTNTVAETPLLNYQIVRIGKQVTFTIKEGVLMQSSATGEYITMNTTPIPSRFLPTHTIAFASIIIIKNYSREAGKVVIDMTDSKLHILGAANVYFANGGFNGFDPFSITYLI